MRDAARLYGGSHKGDGYVSPDEGVSGWQPSFWRRRVADDPKAVLMIGKLDRPLQARRWTAAQAFRTHAGELLTRLSLEKYGPEFAEEFAKDYTGDVEPQDATDAAREVCAQELVKARGFRVYTTPIPVREIISETPPDTDLMSVFEVERQRANSVPELAQTVADYYSWMETRTAVGAGDEVAQALGASSLDHLNEAWQAGMRAPDPVAAGQAVMDVLSTEVPPAAPAL